MTNSTWTIAALAAALAAGLAMGACSDDPADPPDDPDAATPDPDAAPGNPVANCAEIVACDAEAQDGSYVLTTSHGLMAVYCHDMASGTPVEYLELVNTGGDFNFSKYAAGGNRPGTDVFTHYTRVPLDVETLLVPTFDTTFATSVGDVNNGQITEWQWGIASDCIGPGSDQGQANIDLNGTGFVVNDNWMTIGSAPGGSVSISMDRKVVDLTGGGNCGDTVPEPKPDDPPRRVQLEYQDPGDLQPFTCQ